ncbi:MAG: DUF29 domain-containing protein [Cyanobacteria bacterium QS_8_64_29]|nr:MAG: DUF29 domain-containing protein [Cyanobacteria bacterium QS_8_64_29]
MHETKPANLAQLYETDYARWLDEAIERLKAREFDALDLPNLIEELADMGRNERRALASNLRVFLQHLLKWVYQPEQRTSSWRSSIIEHRERIQEQLADSPSLKPYLAQQFERQYTKARKLAASDTDLPLERFPAKPPFSTEQVLDETFLPEP